MVSDSESAIFVAALFAVLAGMAAYGLFLRALEGALERCAPGNRTVRPGQVWLGLIPGFNLVWLFILAGRIADSLEREFAASQAPAAPGEDFGRGPGTAMCALPLGVFIPYLGIWSGLAGLVCWVAYWVGTAGYARALDSAGSNFAGTIPKQQPQAPAPGSGWPVLLALMLGYGAIFLQRAAISALTYDQLTSLLLSESQFE
jgi:hypothetical protein